MLQDRYLQLMHARYKISYAAAAFISLQAHRTIANIIDLDRLIMIVSGRTQPALRVCIDYTDTCHAGRAIPVSNMLDQVQLAHTRVTLSASSSKTAADTN